MDAAREDGAGVDRAEIAVITVGFSCSALSGSRVAGDVSTFIAILRTCNLAGACTIVWVADLDGTQVPIIFADLEFFCAAELFVAEFLGAWVSVFFTLNDEEHTCSG